MNCLHSLLFAVGIACIALTSPGVAQARTEAVDSAQQETFFEQRIRPLLVQNCMSCHSSEKARGGLSLATRAGWMAGGDGGPVIVPGKPAESRILEALAYTNTDLSMPPSGKLSDSEIAWITQWIQTGAFDPRKEANASGKGEKQEGLRGISIEEARKSHWSFQPIADEQPPPVKDSEWPKQPLDHFILAELESAGLHPAPETDRRTWLRRVTFDLIGLPPTPSEIDRFLADSSAEAHATVVERLLSSPHYGERWGRYWLDVARYADSNGLDENLALGHAYRYRDWVVKALNQDLPYDKFLSYQIAGDLLPEPIAKDGSVDREALFDQWTATGFLTLGPKMLAEQDKEKLLMDSVDEQLDVASQAFLGMTVGCARCHDHKFDPIPTKDYYALAGVFRSTSSFANLNFVSRWRERPLATAEELKTKKAWDKAQNKAKATQAKLEAQAARIGTQALRNQIAKYLLAARATSRGAILIEAEAANKTNLNPNDGQWGTKVCTVVHTVNGGRQFAAWDFDIEEAGEFVISFRYAAESSRPMQLRVDGQLIKKDALAETTGGWLPSNQKWLPQVRIQLAKGRHELEISRMESTPHIDRVAIVAADHSGNKLQPDWLALAPKEYQDDLSSEVLRNLSSALTGAGVKHDPVFGPIARFMMLPDEGYLEAARIVQSKLIAHATAKPKSISPAVLAAIQGDAPHSAREAAYRFQTAIGAMSSVIDEWEAAELAKAKKKKKKADPLAKQPAKADYDRLFAKASPFTPSQADLRKNLPNKLKLSMDKVAAELASLKKTKPRKFDSVLSVKDGEVADIPIHRRGSHLTKAKSTVPRGFLDVVSHLVPQPTVPEKSSGRLEWAQRMTQPEHPLTSRVMVNRLWQGHFGRGIVPTASNFGLRGIAPSHPKLLDYLARSFVKDKWSIKALHRRIVLSATYRMSSTFNAEAAEIDPENKRYWRKPRLRLDAESLRDAVLAVSGQLELSVGGTLLKTSNGGYVTNDQSGNKAQYSANRRSLYLPLIRNAMYDLFLTFDYNDPSTPVARRPSTVVPSQALFVMNSPLWRRAADGLAQQVLALQTKSDAERIAFAWQTTLARLPHEAEVSAALTHLDSMREKFKEPASGPRASETQVSERTDPERAAWQSLLHVVLSMNEFLYID